MSKVSQNCSQFSRHFKKKLIPQPRKISSGATIINTSPLYSILKEKSIPSTRFRHFSSVTDGLVDGEIITSNEQTKKQILTETAVDLEDDLSLDTIFATAGCDPSDPQTGAVTPPIYLATTYERDEELQLSRGFNYSRLGNPTRQLFEKTFVQLEKGREAFAFSSGMQAAVALLMTSPGAHVLLPDDLYHGVYVILVEVFSKWGLTFEKIDITDHKLVKKKLTSYAAATEVSEVGSTNKQEVNSEQSTTKKKIILWLETPSNPLCKVTDIQTLSTMAKSLLGEERLCVVVDATWATPYLLRPLTLGADFVLHSTTKYVGGHSDLLGGILVAGQSIGAEKLLSSLRLIHQVGGGVCSPFDSWLALRGLRTLPVRMRSHCESALAVAEYLSGHSSVQSVNYPGLVTHPQHRLATEQMGGRYGGMLSFLVKNKNKSLPPDHAALQVVKKVKRFKRATSLGGTESLIEHRASIETFGSSPPNLLRLSIGLEDVGDLITDLDVALRSEDV